MKLHVKMSYSNEYFNEDESDWSDSSPEINEIFDVNHDSDNEGHSGGDTIEVGSLLLDHISESLIIRSRRKRGIHTIKLLKA